MTASTGEKIANSNTKKPRRGFWRSVGDAFRSIGRGIRRAWHWTKAKAKQGWAKTKAWTKTNWSKFKVQAKIAWDKTKRNMKVASKWIVRNTRTFFAGVGAAATTAATFLVNNRVTIGILFALGWFWAWVTAPVRRKTTVTTTTHTTDGDIVARELLPSISEVINNPDSTETEKAFYTEISDSLDRQEAEVVASDFAHTDENFPGVKVLVDEDLAIGELYQHEAVQFQIAGNKVIEAMMAADGTYVDFDFAPFRGEHKDLMEALEWCLGASRTTDEASFWTGRLEALNAYMKDKGKLAQHGRWWSLVNNRYKSNPEYKLKLIRTGFSRMVEDLQSTSQKATVGAGARR